MRHTFTHPTKALRYHVSGAIERGEAEAIRALKLSQSIRRHGRATPEVKAAVAALVAAKNGTDVDATRRAISNHAAALVAGGFRVKGESI